MRRSYTREKRTLCGEEYMEVDLYAITPEEHAAKRRKKGKPSTERQRKRNAEHSRRYRVQKANANFSVMGFNVTLTYEEGCVPEEWEQALRDLRNWMRRVTMAACKAFDIPRGSIRYMGLTACGRKHERFHHHILVECSGLTMRQNAEFRQMLEDKWAIRQPDGSYEPMGTANADRLNFQNRLEDLISYFCKHSKLRWYESRNLKLPEEQVPNDTRWSRKQLRAACTDCKDSAYWWEQKYPGWQFIRCVVPEPEAPGTPENEKNDWDADELRCYVVLVRKRTARKQEGRGVAKVRAPLAGSIRSRSE